MKLFIFTIATDVYNNFIDDQINSIDNLFPNIIEKNYIIITDNTSLYNKENILSKTLLSNVFIYEIIDMLHDLIMVNRLNYMIYFLKKSNIEYSDNDLFIYIDADTKFFQKTKEFWDEFYHKVIQYDMFITKYPLGYFQGEYEQAKGSRELDEFCGSYNLTKNVNWIQMSLFGGSIKMLFNLYNDIYLNMLKQDLQKNIYNRHIPVLHDESYMMKIVNDNPNNYNIYVDNLSTIIFCPDYKVDPWNLTDNDMLTFFKNAIVLQKYDYCKKTNKRQIIVAK